MARWKKPSRRQTDLMALVELLLPAVTAHVRTARLVVVAAARRAGLDDDFVADLRLALGEACSRAVSLHMRHAPARQIVVLVQDDATGLTVTVRDVGPAPADVQGNAAGLFDADDDDPVGNPDVALAVVAGLVDDLVVTPSEAGTSVVMRWPLPVRLLA